MTRLQSPIIKNAARWRPKEVGYTGYTALLLLFLATNWDQDLDNYQQTGQ